MFPQHKFSFFLSPGCRRGRGSLGRRCSCFMRHANMRSIAVPDELSQSKCFHHPERAFGLGNGALECCKRVRVLTHLRQHPAFAAKSNDKCPIMLRHTPFGRVLLQRVLYPPERTLLQPKFLECQSNPAVLMPNGSVPTMISSGHSARQCDFNDSFNVWQRFQPGNCFLSWNVGCKRESAVQGRR